MNRAIILGIEQRIRLQSIIQNYRGWTLEHLFSCKSTKYDDSVVIVIAFTIDNKEHWYYVNYYGDIKYARIINA